ncbi:GGDEF domain-containing protein [Niveibacterium sp. SC-1]|uniref:GGDEF domain-containing protein n=1 Tax=Niveibacterium sp. SC-1 TaxID=3135646 RepID=UPI00311E5602
MKRAALRNLWQRVNSAVMLSGGLVMLLGLTLFMLDGWTGFLSGDAQTQQRLAQERVQATAPLLIEILDQGDTRRLERALHQQLLPDGTLISVGVRGADGQLRQKAGPHPLNWAETGDALALRVPLFQHRVDAAGERDAPAGFIEFRFRAAPAPWSLGWWLQPAPLTALLTVLLCLPLFVLYLWRVLVQLDPSRAVPEHVRNAFDSFVEGVLVVDPRGRVLLANRAAREMLGGERAVSEASRLAETPFFAGAFGEGRTPPWQRAMLQSELVEREELVVGEADRRRYLRLSCSPILERPGLVRGCMVTVMDETSLQALTRNLSDTVVALESSRSQISQQNEELTRLATRDPMTGTLNRRALFEQMEQAFAAARSEGLQLACIMADIDHFKRFNDSYGHTVGDEVIVSFSLALRSGVRDSDVLGRYGGEEFCILLRGVGAMGAMRRAETLRASVEEQAGARVVVAEQALSVTASFGVAMLNPSVQTLTDLIEAADAALYRSKQEGRNRVTLAAGAGSEAGADLLPASPPAPPAKDVATPN